MPRFVFFTPGGGGGGDLTVGPITSTSGVSSISTTARSAPGWPFNGVGVDPTIVAYSAKLTADTIDRLSVSVAGKMSWGTGTAAADATFERGTNPNSFFVGGRLVIQSNTDGWAVDANAITGIVTGGSFRAKTNTMFASRTAAAANFSVAYVSAATVIAPTLNTIGANRLMLGDPTVTPSTSAGGVRLNQADLATSAAANSAMAFWPDDTGSAPPTFSVAPALGMANRLEMRHGSIGRAVTVTTAATTTVTSAAAFFSTDVGKEIIGAGIPPGATITAFASTSSITISASATTSVTTSVSICVPVTANNPSARFSRVESIQTGDTIGASSTGLRLANELNSTVVIKNTAIGGQTQPCGLFADAMSYAVDSWDAVGIFGLARVGGNNITRLATAAYLEGRKETDGARVVSVEIRSTSLATSGPGVAQDASIATFGASAITGLWMTCDTPLPLTATAAVHGAAVAIGGIPKPSQLRTTNAVIVAATTNVISTAGAATTDVGCTVTGGGLSPGLVVTAVTAGVSVTVNRVINIGVPNGTVLAFTPITKWGVGFNVTNNSVPVGNSSFNAAYDTMHSNTNFAGSAFQNMARLTSITNFNGTVANDIMEYGSTTGGLWIQASTGQAIFAFTRPGTGNTSDFTPANTDKSSAFEGVTMHVGTQGFGTGLAIPWTNGVAILAKYAQIGAGTGSAILMGGCAGGSGVYANNYGYGMIAGRKSSTGNTNNDGYVQIAAAKDAAGAQPTAVELARFDAASGIKIGMGSAGLAYEKIGFHGATPIARPAFVAWTGTATRTPSFATSTATLVNVAEAVKAIIDDLRSYGLYG